MLIRPFFLWGIVGIDDHASSPVLAGLYRTFIAFGKTVLVTAHGNSLRALIKYLDDISDEEIVKLEIPTGNPQLYELDEQLHPCLVNIWNRFPTCEVNLKVISGFWGSLLYKLRQIVKQIGMKSITYNVNGLRLPCQKVYTMVGGRTTGCCVFTGNSSARSNTYTGIRGVRLQIILLFCQEKGYSRVAILTRGTRSRGVRDGYSGL